MLKEILARLRFLLLQVIEREVWLHACSEARVRFERLDVDSSSW